jgi:hypothetical protein
MTTSRSTSRLLGVAAAVCAVIVLATGGVAAAGRKRVVVLEFEGPKGEKFHDDLVRLIKKTHTVVPIEKWNGAAEQLAAGTLSDRDIKKVAHKLKVDAVVEGKIEKRRDEFIIRLKLHEGKTGATIGDTIDTKAEGPRIDGRAQKDLKDELIGAIDNVESNHAGGDDEDESPVKTARKASAGDDDEDDRPAKKGKKPVAAADDEDDRPAKKGKKPVAAADDEDERPTKPGFSRRADDERGGDKVDRKAKKPGSDDDKAAAGKPAKKPGSDDDKAAAGKPAKKPGGDDDKAAAKPVKKLGDDDKAVASKPAKPTGGDDEPRKVTRATRAGGDADDKATARKVADPDDGNPAEADAEADTDPPLEAAAALSPGERAVDAVVGLSVTMRRMSFAVTQALRATPPGYKGIPVAGAVIDATVYPLALGHTRGDQLKNLGIELIYDRVLKLSSQDPMTKKVYSTVEQRFALHAVFRHTLGHGATPPVVLGTLGFVRQSFNILGEVDIPDVKYSILAPGAGIRFPLSAKLTLGADAKLLAILGTGQIGDPDKYGAASVLGFEGSAGADYQITPRIFARAALRIETIGFTFKGTGEQTNRRDGMPMSQDVFGARDTYFGGTATVGYLY